MMPKKIVILFIYILGYISTASLKISNKMAICPENHLQCFFVAKKYLRIFARLDMIGKLSSEAAPQVRMAWHQGGSMSS